MGRRWVHLDLWAPTEILEETDMELARENIRKSSALPRSISPLPDLSEIFAAVLDAKFCNESSVQSKSNTTLVEKQPYARMALSKAANGPATVPMMVEDAFDSLEWDPEMPSPVSPDKSPEPVPIKPQPVAYTTVGSVVNPNSVQQFTAPNRIQREGANRRPLMSILNRQYDSFYQPRGPPPPLNMSNSMHYAQQLAQNSLNRSHAPPTASSHANKLVSSLLSVTDSFTEAEKDVLDRQFSPKAKGFDENHFSPTAPLTPPESHALNGDLHAFSIQELVEEERHHRSSSLGGQLQGLEKMQTLQRLAKFDNPMQTLARSRLAEFSVLKSRVGNNSFGNPPASNQTDTFRAHNLNLDASARAQGELDRSYQFPPPGFEQPSAFQANPLYGAFAPSTVKYSSISDPPPGYPRPLTAGPPGQRTMYSSGTRGFYEDNFGAQSSFQPGVSPWTPYKSTAQASIPQTDLSYAQVGEISNSSAMSKILDTLPASAVSKYYPSGFPNDMTGYYTRLSDENVKSMNRPSEFLLSPEEKKAEHNKQTDDWFYSGQRRFHTMSLEDYISEFHQQKAFKDNPYGPIGPQKRELLPIEKQPLTVENMNKIPLSEATKPLLDAAFGSLLSSSASSNKGSRSQFNIFAKSADWQTDSIQGGK